MTRLSLSRLDFLVPSQFLAFNLRFLRLPFNALERHMQSSTAALAGCDGQPAPTPSSGKRDAGRTHMSLSKPRMTTTPAQRCNFRQQPRVIRYMQGKHQHPPGGEHRRGQTHTTAHTTQRTGKETAAGAAGRGQACTCACATQSTHAHAGTHNAPTSTENERKGDPMQYTRWVWEQCRHRGALAQPSNPTAGGARSTTVGDLQRRR